MPVWCTSFLFYFFDKRKGEKKLRSMSRIKSPPKKKKQKKAKKMSEITSSHWWRSLWISDKENPQKAPNAWVQWKGTNMKKQTLPQSKLRFIFWTQNILAFHAMPIPHKMAQKTHLKRILLSFPNPKPLNQYSTRSST